MKPVPSVSAPPGADTSADVWHVMRTACAVRRFRREEVPSDLLRRCLEAATWAPSGSNEQSWRFVVLRSDELKELIGRGFRAGWDDLRETYGLTMPEADDDSRRARMVRRMEHLAQHAAEVPLFVLFCQLRHPTMPVLLDGACIYPAVQNFLLAARAEGLGTVMSSWFSYVEQELRETVAIPDEMLLAALVAVGWPAGRHVPVRRRPIDSVAALDRWDAPLPG